MSDFEKRLDEFIEREADKVRGTDQQMKCFVDGAKLLAPMLLEMYEAFEKIKEVSGTSCRHYTIANEAAQKIEEMIDEK